jgi:hypothetical protein
LSHDLFSKPTVDDACALAGILAAEYRLSTLFRDDALAHEMLYQIAYRALTVPEQKGGVVLRRDGQLLGVITRSVVHHQMFGCVIEDLFIALMPHDASVMVWAESMLKQMEWQSEYTTVGRISAYHQALLPCLVRLGIGIDAVGLLGSTQTALDGLHGHYELPRDFHHLGLTHSTMKSSDLDCVLELRARSFRLAPEYCWFGANPGHLEIQRQRMSVDLESVHAWYVIRDGARIVGTFGSSVTPLNPMWGPVGGLELIFDPAYHAKGISKIAYAMTLTKLVNHGCAVFKGVTAQPPVMHLGKVMHRRLFDVHLRSASDFEPSHFSQYLSDPILSE